MDIQLKRVVNHKKKMSSVKNVISRYILGKKETVGINDFVKRQTNIPKKKSFMLITSVIRKLIRGLI